LPSGFRYAAGKIIADPPFFAADFPSPPFFSGIVFCVIVLLLQSFSFLLSLILSEEDQVIVDIQKHTLRLVLTLQPYPSRDLDPPFEALFSSFPWHVCLLALNFPLSKPVFPLKPFPAVFDAVSPPALFLFVLFLASRCPFVPNYNQISLLLLFLLLRFFFFFSFSRRRDLSPSFILLFPRPPNSRLPSFFF